MSQFKAFSSDISVVDGERAVSAVISTSSVDRDGEVLLPSGMNAKDWQNNSVIFFNHVYADWGAEPEDKLPVGKGTSITRDADSISMKMVFAERPANHPEGECWLPDTLLSLYQQGVMNAFSVGFLPTETRNATERDRTVYGADCQRVISKWKLLEVSCVPLPANQEAITLAVSKGLVTTEQAKGIFGEKGTAETLIPAPADTLAADAKSDTMPAADAPDMMTCSECGKQYRPDEMDGEMCKECAAKKSAEVPAEPEPVADPAPMKTVVRELDPPPETPKMMVRTAILHPAKKQAPIRKMVFREIKKLRGAIYE